MSNTLAISERVVDLIAVSAVTILYLLAGMTGFT